jgi:hypothetical protein
MTDQCQGCDAFLPKPRVGETTIVCGKCGMIHELREHMQDATQQIQKPTFPEAKAAFAQRRDGMIKMTTGRLDPRAHWERVLANPHAGTYAHMAAAEALRTLDSFSTREPGCDDV